MIKEEENPHKAELSKFYKERLRFFEQNYKMLEENHV